MSTTDGNDPRAAFLFAKIAELIRRHPVAGRLNDIYMGSLRHRLSYEKTLAWRAMHPLRTLKHWWRERAHAR